MLILTLSLLMSWNSPAAAMVERCESRLTLASLMAEHAPGPADLERAYELILERFARSAVWRGRPWRQVCGDSTSAVTLAYSSTLSALSRGLREVSETHLRDLACGLAMVLGEPMYPDLLRAEVNEALDLPGVDRALGFAMPITRGEASPEEMMRQYSSEFLDVKGFRVFGPQHAEMVRLIYQFGMFEVDEAVLYLGTGAPAVLTGVASYLGRVRRFAFDPRRPTTASAAFLRKIDALVEPVPPRGLVRAAAKRGPFRVVAALDVTAHGGAGEDVLRALRDLLLPSGVLILLNDFAAEPPFTREQAIAAGFHVVRWNAARDVARELVPHIYPPEIPRAGELRAFVLRHGPERPPSTMKFHSQDRP